MQGIAAIISNTMEICVATFSAGISAFESLNRSKNVNTSPVRMFMRTRMPKLCGVEA
jgi:hypothetical protein